MERMLALIVDSPATAGAGVFGMLCLAAYPLFRARPLLLATYLGNNLGFAAHYALLGQWTAAAMNMGLGVQTLVAIGLVRQPRLRWAYYALMPLLLAATAMTWQGWPSLLSATATALSTLGRMQRNETALRILMLASAPFWAAHDLMVGSLPGLVADFSCMATGAWMLLQRMESAVAPVTAVTPRGLHPATFWRTASSVSGVTEFLPGEGTYAGPHSTGRRTRNPEAEMSWNMLADAAVDATHVGASFVVAVLLGLPFFLALAALLTGLYSA
jgi:Bacterial inner membrane protein